MNADAENVSSIIPFCRRASGSNTARRTSRSTTVSLMSIGAKQYRVPTGTSTRLSLACEAC